jgi:type IV pilus assembly protein PilE
MKSPISQGFTLIELLVALCILAILLAMAHASYISQIRKASRTEAMDALGRVSAAQEQFLFRYGRYAPKIDGGFSGDPSTSGLGLAITTQEAPGDIAYYDISLTNVSPLEFEIAATPRGERQAADECGVLVLTSHGARRAAKPDCW